MHTGCPSSFQDSMKKLISLLLLSGIICGCHSGQDDAVTSRAGKTRQDSLALKVALMPTLDCLPFYYAQKCGLFKELGLDIRLQTFNAQMDCDTAFARRHVDVSYTDLIRAAWMQSKGISLYVFMQADGHHELVTAKSRRIRQTRHLKERMVAMTRHSVTDLLLDTVIGQARLDPSTVYRPQINDIRLRYGMLANATIDAAFLPEPYATQAKLKGHRSIYDSRKQHIRLMAFMASSDIVADKRKSEQMRLLLQGYNKAVEQINRKEQTDSIRNILLSYPVEPKTVDSLKLPAYPQARKVEKGNVATALRFLAYRHLITPEYTGDTLIHTPLIP